MASVRRDINRTVAKMPGVFEAVLAEAHGIAGEAQALLAEHFRTGEAHIEVTKRRPDVLVELVDPAALSIEYGRGPEENGQGAMEGLHILGRAANL
ncbi:MAG: RoPhRER2 [Frankiales bacterium]|nr:RoPhRER2 [Frankiales bacterium]